MRKPLYSAICIFFLAFSAHGQTRPPNYAAGESIFNSLSIESKALLQVYLIAQGTSVTVPLDTYGTRLHDSITRYQTSRRLPGAGVINKETIEALLRGTRPLFAQWDLRPLAHPVHGRAIWAPMGLGLRVTRTERGVRAENDEVTLFYDFYQKTHRLLYDEGVRLLAGEGFDVTYKLLRDDFFVVSGRSARAHAYMRFHSYAGGALGFMFIYPGDLPSRGDRLTNLISSSLHMQMNYGGLPDLPGGGPPVRVAPGDQQVTRAPPAQEYRAAPPTPSTRKEETAKDEGPSSGTGFFVSASGHILTNQHVVDGCSEINVVPDKGEPQRARLVRADKTNDLAILSTSTRPAVFARFRSMEPRLGENIAAFGFPLAPLLSRSGNFTLGNVTSLAGLGDDSRFLQISAPVQSGNSGGPLLDHSGHITGIVTAKLNAIKTAAITGDIPQNVNFAVKSQMAVSFLAANQVKVEYGATGSPTLTAPDLAEQAKSISVYVECKSAQGSK